MAELLYDPDGDPIGVTGFASENTLLVYGDDINPGAFPDDEAEGVDSISVGFGVKKIGGEPSKLRRLTLERGADPARDADRVLIHHDGEASDNNSDNFDNIGFARDFAFSVSVGDGQLDQDGEPIASQVEVVVRPWNKPQTAFGGPTEAPWLTAVSSPDLTHVNNVREDSRFDPTEWGLSVGDLQPHRDGAALEEVGDAIVDLIDGSLIRRHALVLDGSGGAAEATLPGLIYDSATAEPRPLVESTLATPAGVQPTSITAEFTWYDHVNRAADAGRAPRTLTTEVTFTDFDDWDFGNPKRFTFSPPEAPMFSGVYRWTVEFTVTVDNPDFFNTGDSERLVLTQSGETAVVVQKQVAASAFGEDSPTAWDYRPQFGDGWALEGVPHLFVDDDRLTSDFGTNDDRLVLWFPGAKPRVFGIGDIEVGSTRQSYDAPNPAGWSYNPSNWGAFEFASVDVHTGLVDPLEFGKLRVNDAGQIVYTAADATDYVFERKGTSSEPLWRLREIRSPNANAPIVFTYADATHKLQSITATDGGTIDGLDTADPRFILSGGDAEVRLDLDAASNRLEEIVHENGSHGDRVRVFDYKANTSLLDSDRWGSGERLSTFDFNDAAQLQGVHHGASATASASVDFGDYTIASLHDGAVIRATGAPQQSGGVFEWSVAPSDDLRRDGERVATVGLNNSESGAHDTYTRHTFDHAGNRLRIETYTAADYDDDDLLTRDVWAYDHLGSALSHLDPLGRTTRYEYDYQRPATPETANPLADSSGVYDEDDFRGLVTRVTSLAGVETREYVTDDGKRPAIGRLARQVDPSGLETRQEWNRFGQIIKRTIGDTNVETWEYYQGDENNEPFYSSTHNGLLARHTDARGLVTVYAYDAQRRLETMTVTDDGAAGDGANASRAQTTVTEYAYDDNGYLESEAVVVDGAALSFTAYTYDSTGLPKKVVVHSGDGDGGAPLSDREYEHYQDGLVREQTIGASGDVSKTEYAYDKRGLLTSSKRYTQRSGTGAALTTVYNYYDDGRLQKTTLPDSSTVAEAYSVVDVGGLNHVRRATTTSHVAGASVYQTGSDSVTTTHLDATVYQLYDPAGRLLNQSNSLTGAETSHAYHDLRHDAPTRVTERVTLAGATPTDVVSTFVYDAQGNPLHERTPGAAPVAYVYNALGQRVQTTVLSKYGATHVFEINPAGDVLRVTEHRKTPDDSEAGYATSQLVTDYAYDESGRLRETTDSADDPNSGGGAQRTATVAYANSTTGGVATRTVTTTSLEGVITSVAYDGAGRLREQTNPYSAVTLHEYDLAGNLTKTTEVAPTGGSNRITAFVYDGLDRVTQAIRHGAATDANKLTTHTAYNDTSTTAWDVVVTDPHGVVTKTRLDSLGNRIATRESGAAGEAADDLLVIHSYDYHAGAGLAAVTTRTTSPRGESSPGAHDETRVARSLLNTRGQALQSGVRTEGVHEPDTLPLGAWPDGDVFVDDADVSWDVRSTNAYGPSGALLSETDATGETTNYEYDTAESGTGAVSRVKRPDADELRYRYDSAGALVERRQERSGEAPINVTRWTYDAAGRPLTETITIDTASGGTQDAARTWSYTGSTTTATDRNGVAVTTAVDYGSGTTTVSTAGYSATYAYFADGSLRRAADSWTTGGKAGDSSSIDFAYDEYGRLASETSDHTFAGVTAPTTVARVDDYYANGLRQSATLALGGVDVVRNTYGLDDRGRVSGVSQQHVANALNNPWLGGVTPENKAVSFEYNANGLRESVKRFSVAIDDFTDDTGVTSRTDYAYNAEFKPTAITHLANPASSQPFALAQHVYAYDANGRVERAGAQYKDAAGALLHDTTHANVYDRAGQLQSVTGSAAPESVSLANPEAYHRDGAGNVSPAGVTVGLQNRLLAAEGVSYKYDSEGRLVERRPGGESTYDHFEWDHRGLLVAWRGRLAEGDQPVDTVEFHYDALGRKLARRLNSSSSHTHYVWDGADLALEVDALAGDKVVRGYLNGPGVNETLAVDQAFGELGSEDVETLWQLPDHAGTVRSVARVTGATNWDVLHRGLDPAGAATAFAGTGDELLGDTTDAALVASPVIYAGHHWDDALGLYDARARWLDPETQRFLSEDPLGEAGGSPNLYLYAAGDPVNYVDPDGRAIFTTSALVGAGIYLGWQGVFSAAETGVELAATKAFGTAQDVENFSTAAAFAKNFAINVATGGIGGKVKAATTAARIGKQAGLFAGRQAIEIAGDTGFDVAYNERGVREALAVNTAGSLLGEAAGRAIGGGIRSFHRNFEVTLDSSGVYLGSGLGGAGGLRIKARDAVRDELAPARNATGFREGVFEVGLGKDLRRNPIKGTQVNHAPQSREAELLIGDFSRVNKVGHEPAIRLPISEHTAVTAAQRARGATASARDLLADEIRILRNNTSAPNSSLREVINLTKRTHPFDFRPLHREVVGP